MPDSTQLEHTVGTVLVLGGLAVGVALVGFIVVAIAVERYHVTRRNAQYRAGVRRSV